METLAYLNYMNEMQQELFGTVPREKSGKSRTPYECFRERLACFGELEVLDGEWEKTKACLAEFSVRKIMSRATGNLPENCVSGNMNMNIYWFILPT